ncbi:MAG TPA: GntR family transcriptional regulator [Gaiellaceae bacterium]|nr:GntR family transcriptional regulator [Gaiellaceae bacterium]
MPSLPEVEQPRYLQVYRLIASQISSGRLSAGERVPPERLLMETLGVSRTTVRKALELLAADGLIESSPRRGSFVAFPPLAEPANRLMSFSELGTERGLTPSAQVLGQTCRPATIEEAEVFAIAPGADIFELSRLRMLDQVPVAVDRVRVPLSRVPELPSADFATESLYAVLDRLGAGPVRAAYTISSAAADAEQGRLLEIPAGEPLLIACTTTFDAQGKVVELGETAYRSDRYRFQTELVRAPR